MRHDAPRCASTLRGARYPSWYRSEWPLKAQISHEPWDHFVTLTFKHRAGQDAVRQAVAKWIRRTEQRAKQPTDFFWAMERSEDQGLHVHALTRGTAGLTEGPMESVWQSGKVE